MKKTETEHYIFHYGADTKAEQDIEKISAYQESCFRYICSVLGVTPTFKIEYYLCDSPEKLDINMVMTIPATDLLPHRIKSTLFTMSRYSASVFTKMHTSSALR